ncbi:hypothetical protein [Nocardia carnea]|uniref:hypothetical protein n=1 Tax=Nocardia carnea TaxID=37328 RepID=UPI002456951C|nr:hypothetical protein [Nocardia carnea]
MTLEEYLNSEASSSAGSEGSGQEPEDTQTAAAAPCTGTPVSTPTHPAPAGTSTETVTTSFGSLNGILTTRDTRPVKGDHHPQQVLSATSSHGNQP